MIGGNSMNKAINIESAKFNYCPMCGKELGNKNEIVFPRGH